MITKIMDRLEKWAKAYYMTEMTTGMYICDILIATGLGALLWYMNH